MEFDPSMQYHWGLAPIYFTFGMGFYAFYSIMRGISRVKDHPNAKPSLMEDIKRARIDLAKAGFEFG